MINTKRFFVKKVVKAAVYAFMFSGIASTCANAMENSSSKVPAPSINDFIESMTRYHPYVLAINEGNYQAAAELEIARSNFDPFIEQKTKSRVSGYYDGTNLTQRFTNPVEDYNANVFTEYLSLIHI